MALRKEPVSWHENNLKNMSAYLKSLELQKLQLDEQVNSTRKHVELLQKRINKAKQLNITEFDENQADMREDRLEVGMKTDKIEKTATEQTWLKKYSDAFHKEAKTESSGTCQQFIVPRRDK